MQNHASTLAAEFKLDAARVAATVALIDEGNTIPFIARYRKEATGSMDDQTLRALDERLSYLRKLDDQKETVHNSITEQGAMTPEIAAALEKAKTLAEVEDIYRPYKPKRKTRAYRPGTGAGAACGAAAGAASGGRTRAAGTAVHNRRSA